MDRLITILRAAHCRSTHQFFVLDALPLVQSSRAKLLRGQLLKHHMQYIVGAKDPDKKFRDFRNHVLHVGDGHWGGAPKTAEKWYATLIEKMNSGNWSDAAYAAGVLSHYFTDPLMPLHTAQSEIESIVHRPMEWSVTKSYDKILNRWKQGDQQVVTEFSNQPGWLADAITSGAEVAHRHYVDLIRQYDLKAGSKRPTEGFNDRSIDTLSGLFGIAITGWSQVLERAANESTAEIPESSLTTATIVAGIKMPVAWIIRRISSAAEQRAVRAIFHEFKTTGGVTKNLPAEVRSVSAEREKDRFARSAKVSVARETTPVTAAPEPEAVPAVIPIATTKHDSPPSLSVEMRKSRTPSLKPTDDLVDAPSIGPKTAKRFAKIGITTVAEFLAASADEMAGKIATRWIDADTIRDWQAQATLVCGVAGLCGYKSQLLVAADVRTVEALGAADGSSLHRKIKDFAETSAGRRVLRKSALPTRGDVVQWITDAAANGQRKSA